ncbi:MAG: guanylate kinase [Kiritimatiellia bacterium]
MQGVQDKRRRPLLIVISAPSGAGKTTLCDRLRADYPELAYSISCTTRPRRGNEKNGREYYFLSEEEFERKVQTGEFLEHARVHGYRYGTPVEPIRAALRVGRSVLLDIDVQGAEQLRARIRAAGPGDPLGGALVDIFVDPPSLEELKRRLERRGLDTAETIERRLKNAEREMQRAASFRYRIVNDNLEEAYHQLKRIIEEEWRTHD